MAKEQVRQRRARGSIDPEMILDGAFEVAEQVGVDNLSMPHLAAHLGVGVTSIYWHYRNKDDLLRRMSARALEEIHDAMPSVDNWKPEDWRGFLEAHFTTMHDLHSRSDLVTDITMMRGSTFSARSTRSVFSSLERLVDYLERAGFSIRLAWHVYAMLSTYTRGIITLERSQRVNQAPPPHGLAQLALLEPVEMPVLTRLVVEEKVSIDMGGDENFRFALAALLDTAERLLAAERSERDSGDSAG